MEFRFRAKSGNKTFDEPSYGKWLGNPITLSICSYVSEFVSNPSGEVLVALTKVHTLQGTRGSGGRRMGRTRRRRRSQFLSALNLLKSTSSIEDVDETCTEKAGLSHRTRSLCTCFNDAGKSCCKIGPFGSHDSDCSF